MAGASSDSATLQTWADSVRVVRNGQGREELRDADDFTLVSDFDRPELEKAVKELMVREGSSVLEVGFGLGIAAELIQRARPASHVIVECAPAVLRRLRAWAEDRPSVTVVEGTWQSCLPRLGAFDRIFFDASRDLELNSAEMERCSDPRHHALYQEALREKDARVVDAFDAAARAAHCRPNARVATADGSEFRQWADGFFFSVDSDGKEQLLDADGAQVMMEWEKPYMEECVRELGIDGTSDVLEVGFGCAYSAECIQRAGPRSHTIIECAEEVLKRLRVWAADKPNVHVVEGTWQARLPELGVFDCIFFDDWGEPGLADREMERCPRPEYRSEYEETFAQEGGSHFEAFVRIALAWHARKGTRLSGFMMHMLQNLDDACVESHYRYVPVAPPTHCNYFFSQRAVVPLFTQKGAPRTAGSDHGGSTRSGSPSSHAAHRSSRATSPESSRSRSRSRSPVTLHGQWGGADHVMAG